MKKIFLSLIAAMACINVNAQWVAVYEDGTLKATYINNSTHTYKVDFEEASAPAGPEYVTITSTDGTTTRWATMNLGATTVAESAATAYGDYYAWGATDKWYGSISWSSNTSGTINGQTKTFTSGKTPSVAGTTLSSTEDIATITLGNVWRMPTSTELTNLYNACGGALSSTTVTSGSTLPTTQGIYWCDGTEKTTYKVPGMLFIDSKGAKLFFPAAGYISNSTFDNPGVNGNYWTSTKPDNATKAYRLYFNSSEVSALSSTKDVYRGLSVRPVFIAPVAINVYEDGVLKETYTNNAEHTYKVVFAENIPDPNLLTGKFTVAEGKQVQFTKGNLWYGTKPLTGSDVSEGYHFEANQQDYPVLAQYTSDGKTTGTWLGTHVGHFYWSTTTDNGGTADYLYSGHEPYAKTYDKVSQNFTDAFCYGEGNKANITVDGMRGYYALTMPEWNYLLETRSGNRFAKAMVNSVKGLLIFPDGYTLPDGYSESGGTGMAAVNTDNAAYPTTSITSETWSNMQSAGIVFLPAAAGRSGSSLINGEGYGYFWSATPGATYTSNAYNLYFSGVSVAPANDGYRSSGASVRLVK